MKKLLALFLVFLLLLPIAVFADGGNIQVKLDGYFLSFDQPPVMQNDRVLVPLRAIFEALNATVEWDDATQTVTSTKGSTTVTMQINNQNYSVNGENKTMDVPPLLLNSRTLIPVRAVAESFGCKVGWEESTSTVLINSDSDIEITTQTLSKTTADFYTFTAQYPQINETHPSIAVTAINESIASTINDHIDNIKKYYENAGILFNKSYDVEYGITNKSDNLLSILYTSSSGYSGGDLIIRRFADVYKLNTGEKATLTDYFPNKTEEEIIGMFITDFNMIILQEPDFYYEDSAELVEIHIDDLVVYPCGKEIAVSFNPGIVAPYEMGFITITYPAE